MKTKRLVTLAVTFLITLSAMAQQAVTLSGFYQDRYRISGTATLSNNTQQKIHNVSFRIIYYDMNGKQLDYKDFTEQVDIDPGMSKAIEIESFGSTNNYIYCDQMLDYYSGRYTPFKVGFQLKSVDGVTSKDQTVQQLKPANKDAESENDSSDAPNPLFASLTIGMAALIGIILLACSLGWFVAVYLLARLYGQNPWIWILVSFVLSPILAFILILIFGHKKPRLADDSQESPTSDRWEQ